MIFKRNPALFTLTIVCLLFAPTLVSAGTLTGVISTGAAGNPPLAEALVRTLGEPNYGATTSPTGEYSLIAPDGSYTLLVSAPGHIPQRVSVTISSNSVKGLALRESSQSASPIDLPPPSNWGEPPAAPEPPGDSFPICFADLGTQPTAGSPNISEWSRTIEPDDTFSLTGSAFTTRTGIDAGTDTTVWVWARTSDSGGVLRQATIWSVRDNFLMATMPEDIPYGTYLLWVENSAGVSAPIIVNKPQAHWIGPLGNKCSAGAVKRVVGRNVAHNRGTTTSDAHVYIQDASGGAFMPCTITRVDPYMAEFTVPAGLSNGNYKVFVHSGHGGAYGWSNPVDLVVEDRFVRGTSEVVVAPNGTDDTANLQSAINTQTAKSSGGVIKLSAGDYIIKGPLYLKAKVELKGAGMNSTRILIQLSTAQHTTINMNEDHIGVTDLWVHESAGFAKTNYVAIGHYYWTPPSYDATFTRYKQTADPNVFTSYALDAPGRTELNGCVMYRKANAGSEGYIHNCTLYGDFYGQSEAASSIGDNNVFEYNHIETQNWPTNPANGSRNYLPGLADAWLTWDQVSTIVWAKRVALSYCSNSYIAHNTTKDVAVQDNKGEMILFHGSGSLWFGNVLSNDIRTMTLRTDGLVDGQTIAVDNYRGDDLLVGGKPVPTCVGSSAIIIAGKGFGQSRLIVANTANMITVDSPWLVQPDSTSKIYISTGRAYTNNVVYSNDLNAFPVGYNRGDAASVGWDVDGNGWMNMFEGNTSRRNMMARWLVANGGPNWWNDARNETALDVFNDGLAAFWWSGHPLYSPSFSNTYRDCYVEITGPADSRFGGARVMGEGCVAERITVKSKQGYAIDGRQVGTLGENIIRKGNVTVTDAASAPPVPTPVGITSADGATLLVDNTYAGSTQTYFLGSGVSSYNIPVPAQRVARFKTHPGRTSDSVLIPIANAGIQSSALSVNTSDTWITASLPGASTMGPESSYARLLVSINGVGLSVGRHWGWVDVLTPTKTVRVGVVADVASSAPANLPPIASFVPNPTAGTAPLTVSFNAAASMDSDGLVTGYSWDFGDGTYGVGAAASHTYSKPGLFVPTLTVTDDDTATGSAFTSITITPPLTGVTLSGTPVSPVDIGTAVTLSAQAAGGYLTKYKFLIRTTAGWTTLQDYSTQNTCPWTPSVSGYYEIKCYAKASDSTRAYDAASKVISYPVGVLPTDGLALWLKADGGVISDGLGVVSEWADQVTGSTKKLTQSTPSYRPKIIDSAMNGKPVVRFAGNSCALSTPASVLTGNCNFTTFTRARLNSLPGSNYQYLWWCGADSSYTGYGPWISTIGRMRASWGNLNGIVSTPSTYPAVPENWYQFTSRYTPGAHEFWINGSPIGTATKSDSNMTLGFAVGNYASSSQFYGFFGDIAEVLIYSRKLSDIERQGVELYLSSRWTAAAPLSLDRLKDVRALGEGVLVSITSGKTAITASETYSDTGVYLSETDRTCGLKVTGAGTLSPGDKLMVSGTTDIDSATGETVLRVSSVNKTSDKELGALGMSNKVCTASGQLVRVWGRVTEKTSGYITLDDGSGSPVRVQIDGLLTALSTLPNTGDYMSATGPATTMAGGVTAVRVRSATDIRVY